VVCPSYSTARFQSRPSDSEPSRTSSSAPSTTGVGLAYCSPHGYCRQPGTAHASTLRPRRRSLRGHSRRHTHGDGQSQVHPRSKLGQTQISRYGRPTVTNCYEWYRFLERHPFDRERAGTPRRLSGRRAHHHEAGQQPGDPLLRHGDPQGLVSWRRPRRQGTVSARLQ